MATTVNIYQRLAYYMNENKREGGSVEKPVSVSIVGNDYVSTAAVANGANTTIYNNNLASFTTFYLAADQNTRVLLTDNASNSFSLTIRGSSVANQPGVALILGNGKTTSDNAYITTAQVFNNSGSTSNVVCIAGK